MHKVILPSGNHLTSTELTFLQFSKKLQNIEYNIYYLSKVYSDSVQFSNRCGANMKLFLSISYDLTIYKT